MTMLTHRICTGVIGSVRPNSDRRDDRERLAAIGRQRSRRSLAEVVVDGAPFAHGGDDGGEVVVGEHDLGGLLGGLGALRPMATPTSARFKAGASLTPSPVMATTSPSACSAVTIRSLCSGLVRANTVDVARQPALARRRRDRRAPAR